MRSFNNKLDWLARMRKGYWKCCGMCFGNVLILFFLSAVRRSAEKMVKDDATFRDAASVASLYLPSAYAYIGAYDRIIDANAKSSVNIVATACNISSILN